jgi:hypothetical protein
VRHMALFIATALAGCSSNAGQGEPIGGPCDPADSSPCAPLSEACSEAVCDAVTKTCVKQPASSGLCSAADGGDAAATTQSPSSVDGGVSAPCTETSNCSAGLECIDGACFG